jgi:hypothetical protein
MGVQTVRSEEGVVRHFAGFAAEETEQQAYWRIQETARIEFPARDRWEDFIEVKHVPRMRLQWNENVYAVSMNAIHIEKYHGKFNEKACHKAAWIIAGNQQQAIADATSLCMESFVSSPSGYWWYMHHRVSVMMIPTETVNCFLAIQ